MRQYVFGYGSLIEKESRMLTVPNAKKAIPAKAMDLSRGWWARTKVNGFSTTYLGCLYSDSPLLKGYDVLPYVNGVLFEVLEEDINMLDDREKNYTRVQISLEKIMTYGDQLPDDIAVWIYINDFKDKEDFLQSCPSRDFPIVQSYVDICLNGCLEIENDFSEAKKVGFLKEFIQSTSLWNGSWANDRIFPRRPHIYCKNAFLIDTLLKNNLPDKTIFDSIYIE